MLACVNERSSKSLQKFSGDRVIFKNVHKLYNLNEKFSVEYILSPKTETSSKDYIGIYQRDWKNLTEFVAFEHAITPPREEPSLYRCIEFICRPHLCKLAPSHDYQFVYVSQYHEILGKSNYFQFKFDEERETSWMSPPQLTEDFSKGNLPSVSTIGLTPEEIAYNQCFFGDGSADGLNSASDGLSTLQISSQAIESASSAHFIPREIGVQTIELSDTMTPKRGRPLVKTRDNGFLEVHNISSYPPPQQPMYQHNSPLMNRNLYMNFSNGQNPHHIQGFPTLPYYMDGSGQSMDKHWTFTGSWVNQNKQGKWKSEHESTSAKNSACVTHPMKNESRRGAIPKKCPKCRAPSDFSQQQHIMQHELDQAQEEIRDLRAEVERLKQSMELAEAGQAKLRVSAEMARKEGRYAMTFLNNLMFSLINQYRTKIVNFDNTVMYVTREIQSPGWLVPRNTLQTLVCGRPSNVKIISGRDKELKAIIGRQELKIRDLHSRLLIASRIINKANLLNLKLELSDSGIGQNLNSPQMTPRVENDSPSNLTTLNSGNLCNSSSFDLANLGQVLNEIEDHHSKSKSSSHQPTSEAGVTQVTTVADIHHPGQIPNSNVGHGISLGQGVEWQDGIAVQHSFYPSETVQYGDHEIIWDDEKSVESGSVCALNGQLNRCKPHESNNNNININGGHEASLEPKCGVCHHVPGPGQHGVDIDSAGGVN